MNEKLNTNMDKSYLLSGNLVTTKNEIKDLYIDQEKSQNQIDMMAGALANNIQEVIRVQGRFSDVENGVKENSSSIKDLNRALIIQKEDLILLVTSNYNTTNEKIIKLNDEIDNLNKTIVNCKKCPRLVKFINKVSTKKRKQNIDEVYWGKPVPGFWRFKFKISNYWTGTSSSRWYENWKSFYRR